MAVTHSFYPYPYKKISILRKKGSEIHEEADFFIAKKELFSLQ